MTSTEYHDESKLLVSVFKNYRNSVNIYTEDTDKDKEFYVQLFGRLLENSPCHIKDIFPIGDCDIVKKAAEMNNDPKGFYMIDGDIFVMFKPKQCTENLYVLDAYCIENLIIDQQSILHTVYTLYGCESKEKLQEKLEINDFFKEAIKPFINLFFHFAIERKHCNIFNLKHFCRFERQGKKKSAILDISEVNKEISDIKSRLVPAVLSEDEYKKEIINFSRKYPQTEDVFLKIVSGKDYILPYVIHSASFKLDTTLNAGVQAWKLNMAMTCDLNRLMPLRRAILERAGINSID